MIANELAALDAYLAQYDGAILLCLLTGTLLGIVVLVRVHHWREFYGFSRAFAKVERVYAMTVHKSQGSTYRHVWVNLKDIIRNPDRDEMLRCYYTAITRAAESVHILM